MVKFGAFGTEFDSQFPVACFATAFAQVQLEVVAVRADHNLRKSAGLLLGAKWKAGSSMISSSGSHIDL